MDRSQRRVLTILGSCMAILCAAIAYFSLIAGAVAAGVVIVLLLICVYILRAYQKNINSQLDTVLQENNSAAGRLVAGVNLPAMVFNADGKIVWRNASLKKLFDGTDIKQLPPACNPKVPAQTNTMEYKSGAYQVVNMPIKREHATHQLTFQYWLDRTEAEHYKRLHEEQMPYMALIYVDNYEELAADLQFYRNTVLTGVEQLVAATATSVEGVYRRYDNGRFIMIFEAKYLKKLEQERFALLEQVHKLDTGTEQKVTLSIAVGTATRIAQADIDARQAMELALGRGGDQAVVKAGANYSFYGGRRQLDSGQSRVKARLFAKALRQLIENSTEVFIMGHRQPDMDCIGAALGLFRCAVQAGCRAFIVLDQVNPTIQQAVDAIRENPAYAGLLVSPEAALSMQRSTSVLIVADTQRPMSTLAPELLNRAGKIVLIDHHRRSADYIDNSTLNYLDARTSSTSEMVTETMQYFDDTIRPTAFECSTLLAGITVDTKHFAFNVGARTFEAAAYLRQHGADIGMIKQMFQDDRQTYADRVDTVKSATILCPGVAVAACREEAPNAALIAAQAADALISIRGIDAAFVLGKEHGSISVSGRSLGRINVQIILERIGGGGHLTMAGAQLPNKNLEEGMEIVKATVLKYLTEAEK